MDLIVCNFRSFHFRRVPRVRGCGALVSVSMYFSFPTLDISFVCWYQTGRPCHKQHSGRFNVIMIDHYTAF